MRKALFFVGILPHLFFLNAQDYPLPEVEVSAQSVHFNALGLMDYQPDSMLFQNRHLFEIREMIQYALPATLRLYGPGLIATVRVRGLASEHFKVLWNGLSINNPALGLFDMSGLSANSFEHVKMYQGNVAGFYGSGSGGGVLLLSNQLHKKPFELVASSAAGSFGYRQSGLQTEFSAGNTSAKISVNQHLARNDYTFTNLSLQPQRLTNGSFIHKNLNLNIGHHLARNQVLQVSLWNQSSFINIPPSRVESRFNTARQWNENFRSVITYTKETSHLNLVGGGGWIQERMVYHNDILQSADTHYVKSLQSFLRGSSRLKKGRVLFNSEVTWAEAPSPNRSNDAEQINLLLNTTYESWVTSDLLYALTLRQEWMNGVSSDPVARIAGEWHRKSLMITTSLGNHFRWPTLNERFWIPGGNPNLKPESGFTADLGFRSRQVYKDWQVSTGIQPFVQWIDHLIMWQPVSGIWSPLNVQSARSQGIESLLELSKSMGLSHSIHVRINYCFNKTKITDAEEPMDISIGKQLIYSPLHSGNGLLGYSYKQWSLLLTSQFQSSQHTLYDNHRSGLLQGFTIFNGFIFRNVNFRKVNSKIGFEIRNIANAEYQMIAHRPMPGREIRINFQIQFTKPKIQSQ